MKTLPEKTAHVLFRELTKKIKDTHGIRVENISFTWGSKLDGTPYLTDVRMETVTKV